MEQFTGVTEAFVVTGPVRNVGEPWGEVGLGVADEPGFRGETEQGLNDGQRDEFSVTEFRCNPNRWSFRRPLRVINQEIVDGDAKSGG